MSYSLLSIDPKVVEIVNKLDRLSAEQRGEILEYSLVSLERNEDAGDVDLLQHCADIDNASLKKLCIATSTLIWETAKIVWTDVASLVRLLTKIEVSGSLIETIANFIVSRKDRVLALKRLLRIACDSYHDLEWRLQVETNKRSLRDTFDVSFQLKVQVEDKASTATQPLLHTHHLQADYANLAHVAQQLQRAVDDFHGTHAQRVMKYIN